MLRARFEPTQNSVDDLLDDNDSDRTPPPQQLPSRSRSSRENNYDRMLPPPQPLLRNRLNDNDPGRVPPPSPMLSQSRLNDSDSDRNPLPLHQPPPTKYLAPSRLPKPVRPLPPALIGTRTSGRKGCKQQHLPQIDNEYGITLKTRPGGVNIQDAFLIALEVVAESASWNQGLRSKDLFIKFGTITKQKFAECGGNLGCLMPIVYQSLGKPIECFIIRSNRLFDITLRGLPWPFGVCLGVVINSYPEPIPLSQRPLPNPVSPSPAISTVSGNPSPTQPCRPVLPIVPARNASTQADRHCSINNFDNNVQESMIAFPESLYLLSLSPNVLVNSVGASDFNSNFSVTTTFFQYSSPVLHFNSPIPAFYYKSKAYSLLTNSISSSVFGAC